MIGRRIVVALVAALVLVTSPPARADTGITHEVRAGETLAHIAFVTWGDALLWPAIYLANRDRIKDPTLVYPGQRLAIPDVTPKQHDALRREARAHRSR